MQIVFRGYSPGLVGLDDIKIQYSTNDSNGSVAIEGQSSTTISIMSTLNLGTSLFTTVTVNQNINNSTPESTDSTDIGPKSTSLAGSCNIDLSSRIIMKPSLSPVDISHTHETSPSPSSITQDTAKTKHISPSSSGTTQDTAKKQPTNPLTSSTTQNIDNAHGIRPSLSSTIQHTRNAQYINPSPTNTEASMNKVLTQQTSNSISFIDPTIRTFQTKLTSIPLTTSLRASVTILKSSVTTTTQMIDKTAINNIPITSTKPSEENTSLSSDIQVAIISWGISVFLVVLIVMYSLFYIKRRRYTKESKCKMEIELKLHPINDRYFQKLRHATMISDHNPGAIIRDNDNINPTRRPFVANAHSSTFDDMQKFQIAKESNFYDVTDSKCGEKDFLSVDKHHLQSDDLFLTLDHPLNKRYINQNLAIQINVLTSSKFSRQK